MRRVRFAYDRRTKPEFIESLMTDNERKERKRKW